MVAQSIKSNDIPASPYPVDIGGDSIELFQRVQPILTSIESVHVLSKAVEYIVANDIPGSFIECGVWKAGSMMAAAITLVRLGCTDRDLWLYDTYEGMPEPSEVDVSYRGESAIESWNSRKLPEGISSWCLAPLDEVKERMQSTGYPAAKIHYVKGKVEETIPAQVPDSIALLRLDTDFYESTKHELMHLFPRLVAGGILIVDDYGHWQGSRMAVDEYIEENRLPLFLNRIDYTGRIAVKLR
jgi:O-methyltransferase